MKDLLIVMCFLMSVIGCSQENYNDISSSEKDISYYNLVEREVTDDNGTVIRFSIPNEWQKIDNDLLGDGELSKYELFDNTGYAFSIAKLESRNTVKLDDKTYLKIITDGFETEYSGDIDEIGRLLPSSIYKDVQIVQFDSDLIINENYFGRRIGYFIDGRLENTYLEDVNVTEFHFFTLQNKRKYTITISYYGDDKDISNLIGIMNTIGGSVKFE